MSLFLISLLSIINVYLLTIISSNNISNEIYLAIGAGIWEEFLFRLILISLSIKFLIKILNVSKFYSILISILLSSLLFSFFHYIGSMKDLFTFNSFLFRVLAGIILSTIYINRGFGIASYTHIFYDMLIVSFPLLTER